MCYPDENYNNEEMNTVWAQDRSFLKLRNCEIYYKLPLRTISKVAMRHAKVYVRGIDLLCFDHIKKSDPEALGNVYPATRSINAGLAIEF